MIINCIIYELLIARMMFRGIEILIILTFFLPQDMLRLLCFSFLLVGGSSTQQHKVCHPNTALQPCYFLSLPWKKVVDFVACCMSFICFKGQIWLYIYIYIYVAWEHEIIGEWCCDFETSKMLSEAQSFGAILPIISGPKIRACGVSLLLSNIKILVVHLMPEWVYVRCDPMIWSDDLPRLFFPKKRSWHNH